MKYILRRFSRDDDDDKKGRGFLSGFGKAAAVTGGTMAAMGAF